MAFYYYGRKKKIGGAYPPAKFDTLIEPFAGSAAYACRPENRHRQVILIDADTQVVEAWRWLLGLGADVADLPPLTLGERTTTPIHIMHSASKRWWQYRSITVTAVMVANWDASRRWWRELLPQIAHWQVLHGDYSTAPDIEATWFVDPPYPGDPGTGYRHGSGAVDYAALASWCRSRSGQVIACGHDTDDWLPFVPLTSLVGVAGKRSSEAIWHQSGT